MGAFCYLSNKYEFAETDVVPRCAESARSRRGAVLCRGRINAEEWGESGVCARGARRLAVGNVDMAAEGEGLVVAVQRLAG